MRRTTGRPGARRLGRADRFDGGCRGLAGGLYRRRLGLGSRCSVGCSLAVVRGWRLGGCLHVGHLDLAAENFRGGALVVKRDVSITAGPGAAYVTFRNTGDQLEKLVGISTPAAAHPEVHEMTGSTSPRLGIGMVGYSIV